MNAAWWADGIPRRPALSDKLADWEAFVLVGGQTFLKDRSVLEIGPEYGLDTVWFSGFAKRWTVLDNAPDVLSWIASLSRMAPGFDLIKGDACKLPFPDGEFQLVLDYGTFDNTADPFAAYREACRVLSRHGVLISTYANEAVLGKSNDPHETRVHPDDLRDHLESLDMWVRWRDRHSQARAVVIAQKYAPQAQCTWDSDNVCRCKPDTQTQELRT